MTEVWMVQAEHYSVPGIIVKLFDTEEKAKAECVALTNIMLEDMKLPHADLMNWEGCVEILQDTHGAAHCYVECSHMTVR